MKRILVTLTFALGAFAFASAVVPGNPSSAIGHPVLLSDDDPPPVCPPICAPPGPDGLPIVIHRQ
jgi:hypothetical protein